MESRLSSVLKLELINAHLRLDPDQLSSGKVSRMFLQVYNPYNHTHSGKIFFCQEPYTITPSMSRFREIYPNHHYFFIHSLKIDVKRCLSTHHAEYLEDISSSLPFDRSLLSAPR